jgi:hypothetical protein
VFVTYLAARIRPGAALVFTMIIVIAVVAQLIVKGDDMPMWKLVAAVVSGPYQRIDADGHGQRGIRYATVATIISSTGTGTS